LLPLKRSSPAGARRADGGRDEKEEEMAAIDEARLEGFMGRLVGYMTGGATCLGIWLGDELGLYTALADGGPMGAEDLGARTGCNARLVREWLDGQAAAGLVDYDDSADSYSLSAEAAMALADETSPVFTARAMNAFGSMFFDFEKIKSAFRGDGALAWGDHHACLFKGTEWFFRTGYRANLPGVWIPALDGVQERLEQGARVADVGCGHGASVIVMAEAYPNSQFYGFDYHGPSIEVARERAAETGVADRSTFEVAGAKEYPGSYDLICFFDCLHDMGDPVGIAAYARERLAPEGCVLLVEPFALDGRRENMTGNPMAALLYTASTVVCTPNSLSQEVGLGLGAQAGEARLRAVFEEAGFSHFRRATESPLNLILEARA
jgi:2-polyprenyl-3-methyl-5-hydroxy-6-metoxy-1,4-benzoquinol methylase